MAAANELAESLGTENLYAFFNVEKNSTDKEITKAYRKKALKYHPDKNPGDKKAAELFHKLSQAYDILTDPAAKAAYDNWLKARAAAKERNEKLSVKRRKFKEELESKESQQRQTVMDEVEANRKMQKEIERLREEGKKRIAEHEEELRKEFLKTSNPQTVESESNDVLPTLKVVWKSKKTDATNGGYNKEVLQEMFSKYGPLNHVLVSTKKNGKALISFQNPLDALRACENEQGLSSNPLQITWIEGQPSIFPSEEPLPQSNPSSHIPTVVDFTTVPSSSFPASQDKDYESITLMRMRQAEERKRLAEQLATDDDDL